MNLSTETPQVSHVALALDSWDTLKVFNLTSVFIFAVIGTLGNIFIIGAILLERSLKYLGNVFIINLAIVDLIMTGYCYPTTFANMMVNKSALPRAGCIFTGFMVMISATGSVLNLFFIALDRYVAVCHTNFHKCYFNKPLITAMVIISWLEPIILASPAILFFNDDLDYDPRSEVCVILYQKSPMWYSISYVVVIIFTPMFMASCLYMLIFKTVRDSKQRVGTKKADNSVYKTLFTVFALFVIFWTPVAASVILNVVGIKVPNEAYRWFSFLGMGNSVINGFIYGFSNKHFRKGYLKFFHFLTCNIAKRTRIAPEESSTAAN